MERKTGIGRAAAIRLAQQGAKVAIAARRVDEGQAVADEIHVFGGVAIFIKTDVSMASDVEALVLKTTESFGMLDIAFNNAGSRGNGMTHELTEEDWDESININLKGTWLCMKHEIIQMLSVIRSWQARRDRTQQDCCARIRWARYSSKCNLPWGCYDSTS